LLKKKIKSPHYVYAVFLDYAHFQLGTTLTDMSKFLCEAIFYTDIIWGKIEDV